MNKRKKVLVRTVYDLCDALSCGWKFSSFNTIVPPYPGSGSLRVNPGAISLAEKRGLVVYEPGRWYMSRVPIVPPLEPPSLFDVRFHMRHLYPVGLTLDPPTN